MATYKDVINQICNKIHIGLIDFSEPRSEASMPTQASSEFITNKRQQDCLAKAKESLTTALGAAEYGELQDLISIDLKSALLFLDEITGEVITDEILEKIFEERITVNNLGGKKNYGIISTIYKS